MMPIWVKPWRIGGCRAALFGDSAARPSDLRDGLSLYPDYYANPVKNNQQARYRNAETLTQAIDTRAGLLDLDSTIDSAFDPYTFVRDAWIQHRRFELYNGNPPPQYPSYPDLPPDEADDSLAPATGTTAPPAANSFTPPPIAGTRAMTPAPEATSSASPTADQTG